MLSIFKKKRELLSFVAFLNNVNALSFNICSSHIYKLYHCPFTCPLQQWHTHTQLPLSLLWALGLLYETQIFLFIIIDFAVWNTGICGTRLHHKTNASLCFELHNNRRPPVFTKCLFNEKCYVSSLSGPLMAPVLLQVPRRCWNMWCWKGHVGLNTHHLTHSRAPTDTSHYSLVLLANHEVHAISLASFQ